MIQSPSAYAKASAGKLNLGSRAEEVHVTGLALRNFSEGGSPDWIIRTSPQRPLGLRGEPGF